MKNYTSYDLIRFNKFATEMKNKTLSMKELIQIYNQDAIGKLKIIRRKCIRELEIIQNLLDLYEKIEINTDTENKYRKIRKKLGMTQKDLAKEAGIGIATVFNFEKGISIRQENYDKIINVLNEN